jgi:hypothetical protein
MTQKNKTERKKEKKKGELSLILSKSINGLIPVSFIDAQKYRLGRKESSIYSYIK